MCGIRVAKRFAMLSIAFLALATCTMEVLAFGHGHGLLRRLCARRPLSCPVPTPCPLPIPDPVPTPSYQKVRRNIASLDQRQLDSLKRGIAAMKALPDDDPRSWVFQANIHGTTGPATSPLFNQCEHGTLQFLTWHRGYLYFFERILRELSGDRDLTLPYWDWTNSPSLPVPFRSPPDSTNPLFEGSRTINDGSSLPTPIVVDDLRIALTNVVFGAATGPRGFSQLLEGSPHGAVHVQVGGKMASVPTAANDPIFWLHHCNIDRLWNEWLNSGGGRHNPADPAFLDQPYTFADESGNNVTVKVRELISSGRLGYRYDSTPSPSAAVAPFIVAQASPPKQTKKMTAVSQSAAASADGRPRTLGLKPTTEALSILPEHRAAVMAAVKDATKAAKPERLVLRVEGLSADGVPEFAYGVYLDLPKDGGNDALRKKHYVGSINFFGKLHIGRGHGHTETPVSFDETFDVTEIVRKLQAAGIWQSDSFTVTLIPLTPVAVVGAEARIRERMEASAVKTNPRYVKSQLLTLP